MATAEERLTILRMIEQGKISPEDGAKLLAALGAKKQSSGPQPMTGPPPSSAVFDTSRALRIKVFNLTTNQPKVNVTVPVGLLRLALRFVPSSAHVDIAELQQMVESGYTGRFVEVVDQDGGTRVEIALE
jgi:hypothetical protein